MHTWKIMIYAEEQSNSNKEQNFLLKMLLGIENESINRVLKNVFFLI